MSVLYPIAEQAARHPQYALATLGGGCFWCVEAAFVALRGVVDVESGYAGSADPRANYEAVCTGTTGLAEVVQILFDPQIIDYAQLLQVFFSIHNPTTLNQQGADKGTQYRSVIFTHDDTQAQLAQSILPSIHALWGAPAATSIEPVQHYTRAEDEHQAYFARHPHQGYCQAVIAPKLAKLRAQYTALLNT
ncbi:MAG: peptide-methionine (S)-S-oxide reductase MsrA [Formosimonas sp.]